MYICLTRLELLVPTIVNFEILFVGQGISYPKETQAYSRVFSLKTIFLLKI